MCWNKEVSLVTFVLAIVGAIYLYNRNKPNDRWIAIFAATVAMIQLAEFFMWSDLDCGKMNMYASIFALIVLAAEPLMNMVGGIYFSDSPYKKILKYMLAAYLFFIIFYYFSQVHGKQNNWCGTTVCPSNNPTSGLLSDKACNLQWYFLQNKDGKLGIIWILFLMLPFLAMTPASQGILFFALGFGSLFMARTLNNAAVGSLWCWMAVIIIYVKILL